MQEELAAPEKVALIQTHRVERSVAPAVLEACNANVWLRPPPDAGVTESAVTVAGPGLIVRFVEFCAARKLVSPDQVAVTVRVVGTVGAVTIYEALPLL